ncbi:DUF202 domain-containing protein [Vibrio sp. FNV 38]|nr:DUF202 domain-containing protein [Vibrio sp. FNV 38]
MTKLRRQGNWKTQGEAPDYRFSLANERTYLAWVRTALALLAAAIAIDQLTPELANPRVRIVISSFLCLCSCSLAVFAYLRWASNEKAMRKKLPMSYTGFLKVVSLTVVILTVTLMMIILL